MIDRFPVLRRRVRLVARYLMAASAAACVGFIAIPARAISIQPLTSFAGGDGWLAPGDRTYLTTNNDQRGLAYNPTTGHLLVVNKTSGSQSINILDGLSGDDAGSLNGVGSTSGGTFNIDMIGIADDGAIYVGNLTIESTTSPFKVYKWATETSTPVVAYSGNAGLLGARVGDSFAAIGSGSSTLLAAGFGNAPAVAGNNGYSIIDPTLGTATAVAFSGTPPNAGDFRLGVTFSDSSHVIGAQSLTSLYRYTSFSSSSGTLIASPSIPDPVGATLDVLLNYTVIDGHPILAIQSAGDTHMTLYDAADLTAPRFLSRGFIANPPVSNGNGTGEVAWGATTVNPDGSVSRNLYGMRSNGGIMAYTVTLPTPPAVAGDYNKNGMVDAADYVMWRATFNQNVLPTGTDADGDGDGKVGMGDYDFWRSHFGNAVGTGAVVAAAVPEPSIFVLALAALACGTLQRRRRWLA